MRAKYSKMKKVKSFKILQQKEIVKRIGRKKFRENTLHIKVFLNKKVEKIREITLQQKKYIKEMVEKIS